MRSGTRVSSQDFCPWWSFWSLPQCLQRCTTELQMRKFCACGNVIHSRQCIIFSVTVPLRFGVGVGALGFTARSIPRHLTVDLFFSTLVSQCLLGVLRRVQYFYHHVPWIKSGKTIHAQTSIQRNNFWFCRTLRHRSFFLAHPTCGNQCSTSDKYIWFSPKLILESSKSPAKSESWNRSCRQCWAVSPTWQKCM